MSEPEEHLEEIIDRIIDLEPLDDKTIKEIELKKPKDSTNKIKSELDKLKITKKNTKVEIGL